MPSRKPAAEGHKPTFAKINFATGSLVKCHGEPFRIQEVLGFEQVLATSLETGRPKVLAVTDLKQVSEQSDLPSAIDLQRIGEDDWAKAVAKYDAIKPLLELANPNRDAVVARAAQVGKDASTLYRWMNRYRNFDAVSGLVQEKRGWREGNSRLSAKAEKVIREVIQSFYLTQTRPSVVKTINEVKIKCYEHGMVAPSPTAIRARIHQIPDFERMKRRGRVEKAKNTFLPVPGQFPGADFPLAVVQIDHTPIDVIVVDDEHRRSINRPFLTTAIDVYSRMIVGYYLSLDAPSVTSVAMCIAQAILPKEEWLMRHSLDSSAWPVWGKPHKVYTDNGPEFRSSDFRKSCEEHGIDLDFRPVKVPRYGGTVERVQGTLMRELHDLPGSTFSSIAEREGYDSDANAALTLDELELQIVKFIVNEYHRRPHSALGMPPLRKWEEGIFGGHDTPGRGMPPRPADGHSILLSFLPSFERTIQADGVTYDTLRYYDPILNPWIGDIDPTTKQGRLHLFRRDPRNLAEVHFFDPESKTYHRVPLADLTVTPFSVWEHKAAKAAAKKQGFDPTDETTVLRSIRERRELVEQAKARTKTARREAQRQRVHAKKVTPVNPGKNAAASAAKTAPPPEQRITSRTPAAPMDEYQALGLLAELPPLSDDE